MVKKTKKDSAKMPSELADKDTQSIEAKDYIDRMAENQQEKAKEAADNYDMNTNVYNDLQQKLQEKEKEAADNYDKYLRTLADLDNYKKRAAREKADSIKYGNENLIRDILPIIDSLERAIKHVESSGDSEALRKGLKMVQEQMMCCLEKYGVKKIDCINKMFDPNLHDAFFLSESDSHEENQIIDELESGYLLNERLLRPAKVSICKREKKNLINRH